MAKITSKKLFAGMLALSAGMILAGCDPVAAVPKNYNKPIVATEEGAIDLEGNNLGTLFDSITGDKNAKVVEKILTEIAEKQFGKYGDFLNAQQGDNWKDFVKKHDYFKHDEEARQKQRFDEFVEDLNARISEYFYNEITSGSYNDDLGRFSEKKLYKAHQYELYDLANVSEDAFKTFFVDKTLTKENAFSSKYLNVAAYQVTDGRGYIKEKVYPDILRNKIVEDYIYRENRSSLGRAYARNVQYVKIPYDESSTFEEDAVYAFAKEHIENNTSKAKINFEILVDAIKGFKVSSEQNVLVEALTVDSDEQNVVKNSYKVPGDMKTISYSSDIKYLNDVVIVKAGVYYEDTKVGQILKEYNKACEAIDQARFPSPENQKALDSFTSEGKTVEYGLLQKISSLVKEDYTTDGWYVKNGGLSELPSKIRDRLFNIRVANDLDKESVLCNEEATVGENAGDALIGGYEDYYESMNQRLPYLREIYGRKLILPTDALKFESRHYNYVLNDTGANAFYMCEVLEAPSTAKLDNSSTTEYGVNDSARKESIGRQVAKVLGTKDSYIKDAYTQFLTPYKFTFFDTSLKDYFKGEYPDLFDDED